MTKKTQKAQPVPVAPVLEEPLNSADFLDTLSWRKVSIGGRLGHERAMRYWSIKRYGMAATAEMSDSEIIQKMIEDGFVPVGVNGNDNESEGVFLIHRDVLRRAPYFTR